MKIPILTISHTIHAAATEVGGYVKLAEKINGYNAAAGFRALDRRKLKIIADGKDDFTISIGELSAIDNYFGRLGRGLSDTPLFARHSLLKAVAENEQLSFLFGAFQRDEEVRNDVSLWDVKSVQEILDGLTKFGKARQVSFRDVPFSDAAGMHNQRETGIPKLLEQPQTSVCVIGSTRSNVAAEFALATMFGVEPFKPAQRKLPFKFLWPSDKTRLKKGFTSAFEAGTAEKEAFRNRYRKAINGELQTTALVLGNEFYPVVPKGKRHWDDYGIVALQRQSNHRVLLVVAGLTGPSTLASAKACRFETSTLLPLPDSTVASDVLWAVVKARIAQSPGIGDVRTVDTIELIGEIRTSASKA